MFWMNRNVNLNQHCVWNMKTQVKKVLTPLGKLSLPVRAPREYAVKGRAHLQSLFTMHVLDLSCVQMTLLHSAESCASAAHWDSPASTPTLALEVCPSPAACPGISTGHSLSQSSPILRNHQVWVSPLLILSILTWPQTSVWPLDSLSWLQTSAGCL